MTGGQTDLVLDSSENDLEADVHASMAKTDPAKRSPLRVVKADEAELEEHRKWLEEAGK